MSRNLGAIAFAIAIAPLPALAQDSATQETYGPTVGFEGNPDATPLTIVEQKPCQTEEREDGAIVVCRELTESDRYLSPIPREVQSDRRIIPGLTDPPCWVTNPTPGPGCIRFGWAPEPAIMVDLTAFPEPLSAQDAARVVAVDGQQDNRAVETGVRVPIDLSEDD